MATQRLRALQLITKALPHADVPPVDFAVDRVTCDSRQATPGSIFIAVPGADADGVTYAHAAAANGAALVVTHRRIPDLSCPQIVVADSRAAAAKVAAAFYGLDDLCAERAKLIGITGTNGKTTVSYVIQHICHTHHIPCARLGTVDYDLIAETITATNTTAGPVELCGYVRQALDHGAEAIVMEVSSHALDQARVAGLNFTSAVFTNLSGDHLDYHDTMEKYLDAKLVLFKGLSASSTAIVNLDDPAAEKVIACTEASVLTYSLENPAATVRVRATSLSSRTSRFEVCFDGEVLAASVPYIGRHNIYNISASVASAIALGLDLHKTLEGLNTLAPVPGRLERVGLDAPFDVFVDYAHTDDGLANVLQALRPIVQRRLIVVFGCGGDRDRSKRPRMAAVAEKLADAVVVTSDNPRTEPAHQIIDDILAGFSAEGRTGVAVEPNRAAAICRAIVAASPGDIVVIAGKGHEPYQIIGTERIAFDDRDQARAALRQLGFENIRENVASG